MRHVLAAASSLFLLTAPAWAQVTNTQLRLQVRSFVWEEFLEGEKLLKEDGPIFGIEGRTDLDWEGPLASRARIQLFYGEVDYDGQTQLGDPVESTTEYYGSDAGIDLRYRHVRPERILQAEPIAGIGVRSWLRRLGPDDDGGYDEQWASVYTRFGAAFTWGTAGGWHYALEAAVRVPFFTMNEVTFEFDDGSEQDLELEPETDLGYDIEASLRKGSFVAALAYEFQEYGKSDGEPFGDRESGLEFFQPDSEESTFTFSAGMVF